MLYCNFKNNYANYGDNVYWVWNVEDFLNKYDQINDYDYVFIRNGVGTPLHTIRLNKKGITIHGLSTNVIFDAKGGNFHFEVTGDNVLIENLSFRNFNFTGNGGAMNWTGNNGTLRNCNFIHNSAGVCGGGVCWFGHDGTIMDSTFSGNTANQHGGGIFWSGANGILSGSCFDKNSVTMYHGGGVYWLGANGTITECNFTNNIAKTNEGGGIFWWGANGLLTNSIFTNNLAKTFGGAIFYGSINATIIDSKFINNNATQNGGAIRWQGDNGILSGSTFISNNANRGGAIDWTKVGHMIDCNFINSRSEKLNGIYADKDLNINGGSGIVYIFVNTTLSGISLVVLNNETYYYPPNSNINFNDYFSLLRTC